MSRNEGVELVSLVSQVRTLKIRIEGYKQHIQIAEKSHKEHVDRLEAKNVELEKKLKILEKALEEIDKSNDCMKYFNNDIHEIIYETREALAEIKGASNE